MRPLAGMGAHRTATLAREVPRHHPDRFEGLSVRPGAPVPPDLHEIGLFEGLEPDSWESRPAHVEGLDLQPDTHGPSVMHAVTDSVKAVLGRASDITESAAL